MICPVQTTVRKIDATSWMEHVKIAHRVLLDNIATKVKCIFKVIFIQIFFLTYSFVKEKSENEKKIRIIIQFLRFLFLFVGCENEMYGVNCKYHCSGHCLNNGTCNFITGFCNNGCSFGYLGDMCNESKKLLKVLKTHVF